MWSGALIVETSLYALRPRTFVVGLFSCLLFLTDFWIFRLSPLPFWAWWRSLGPKLQSYLWIHKQLSWCITATVAISSHGSLSCGKVFKKVSLLQKIQFMWRGPKPMQSPNSFIWKQRKNWFENFNMLQEILVKRFNFKRSAYFPSVIFQKKIWNFVSK